MRFKPMIDKLFFIIWIPTVILMIAVTIPCLFHISTLLLMIPIDLFVFYFLVSSLVGYVELRENTLFIKFGFILKKEIPYEKIRSISKERRFISESMMSLKNSFEHLTVRYNKFDTVCVSVVGNDKLCEEIRVRACLSG